MLSDVLIGINLRTQTQQNMKTQVAETQSAPLPTASSASAQSTPGYAVPCPALPCPARQAPSQACAMAAVPHHLLVTYTVKKYLWYHVLEHILNTTVFIAGVGCMGKLWVSGMPILYDCGSWLSHMLHNLCSADARLASCGWLADQIGAYDMLSQWIDIDQWSEKSRGS